MTSVAQTTAYMQNVLNGTGISYASMHGMSFIDILSTSILNGGWEKFSLTLFIQLYVIFSLGEIKHLFTQANNKIIEYGKSIFNYCSDIILSTIKNYFLKTIVAMWSCITSYFGKSRSPDLDVNVVPDNLIYKDTSYNVEIPYNNTTDLLAIGNFLVKNLKKMDIANRHMRKLQDTRVVEVYKVPHNLSWREEELEIKLTQNINFELVCQKITTHDMGINNMCANPVEEVSLVSVTVDKKCSSEVIEMSLTDFVYGPFEKIYCYCPILNGHDLIVNFGDVKYNCRPDCIAGYRYAKLFAAIYLHPNATDILENLFKAYFDGKIFHFNNCNYKFNKKDNALSEYFAKDREPFYTAFAPHHPHHIHWIKINYLTHYHSYDKLSNMFDKVSTNASVTLTFNMTSEGGKNLNYDVSNIARKWVEKQVTAYYETNTKREANKISIYKLEIEYDSQVFEQPNPEYIKWEKIFGAKDKEGKEETPDKKDNDKPNDPDTNKPDKLIDDKDVHGKPNNRDSTSSTRARNRSPVHYRMFDEYPEYYQGGMNAYNPPPQTIKETKFVPKVACRLIKNDKKPFEYLYLPKKTLGQLKSYLNAFKDNRSLYEEFGYAYRTGLLLSGTPGCGKSTTILACATYLDKDIYYIDLGQLKTNKELRLCIDHIKTSSKNGGVIIFEDIDASTKVVLSRENGTNTPAHTRMDTGSEDDALNLAYILNILDGTMSPENTLFILTSNHPEKLDRALIRPGRIDMSIVLNKCDRYQLACVYRDLYKKQLEEEYLNAFSENTFITAEVILHLFYNKFNTELSTAELLEPFLIKK